MPSTSSLGRLRALSPLGSSPTGVGPGREESRPKQGSCRTRPVTVAPPLRVASLRPVGARRDQTGGAPAAPGWVPVAHTPGNCDCSAHRTPERAGLYAGDLGHSRLDARTFPHLGTGARRDFFERCDAAHWGAVSAPSCTASQGGRTTLRPAHAWSTKTPLLNSSCRESAKPCPRHGCRPPKLK